ncbi:hypothetical protein O9G_004310 [Rozella allomycis CSF55]|uniref:Uncharacterized protein n=1 Tax=Rozella allomycis (strain CSF55) TaxID=988480 RepID=A0A075AVX6_ROZAC|nr:hypothetical protein O9G_004310 [Rozella allomycis CSF55]|eukprot:EPZ32867.1 hypothetical protein O9G_004310 [Rozella allomycis CSF55]
MKRDKKTKHSRLGVKGAWKRIKKNVTKFASKTKDAYLNFDYMAGHVILLPFMNQSRDSRFVNANFYDIFGDALYSLTMSLSVP